MNSTDVIGWVVDGDFYCPDCSPSNDENNNDVQPIFADSETDSFSHCSTCEELIPEHLALNGVEDALKRMSAYLTRREGRPEILAQWAEHLRDYFPSYEVGAEVCLLTIGACDEANIKVTFKNACRSAEGFMAALDKACECDATKYPDCKDPTCNAVRIIKKMVSNG